MGHQKIVPYNRGTLYRYSELVPCNRGLYSEHNFYSEHYVTEHRAKHEFFTEKVASLVPVFSLPARQHVKRN